MGVTGTAPMASKHDGAASYSNIVTISESPVVPGVIWVGTNDGNVQVSRDGGATWKNVVGNVTGVPKETHVSRVDASHFDGGTAYVSFDGHRTDDHKPYIFVTKDFGETWTSVSGNLPDGNVNVIKEDPKNRNLLYAGTEYGFYISLNGGREWKPFMTGLPTRADRRRDGASAGQRSDSRRRTGAASGSWTTSRRCSSCPTTLMKTEATSARHPSRHRVDERHPAGDPGRRREAFPRSEPTAWRGDQLLAEERARRATCASRSATSPAARSVRSKARRRPA